VLQRQHQQVPRAGLARAMAQVVGPHRLAALDRMAAVPAVAVDGAARRAGIAHRAHRGHALELVARIGQHQHHAGARVRQADDGVEEALEQRTQVAARGQPGCKLGQQPGRFNCR
jgi:hypothetical protein